MWDVSIIKKMFYWLLLFDLLGESFCRNLFLR